MPRGRSKKTKRRNGNGRQAFSREASSVIDLTAFTRRRKIKYAISTELNDGNPRKLIGLSFLGTTALTGFPPGVLQFLKTFRSLRLARVFVQFDNRGVINPGTTANFSIAANPRVAAFILPENPSSWDPEKLAPIASYGGSACRQGAIQKYTLRIGPEFTSGRFSGGTVNNTDTLVLDSSGFTGVVRVGFEVETLGPPDDSTAPDLEYRLSALHLDESVPSGLSEC